MSERQHPSEDSESALDAVWFDLAPAVNVTRFLRDYRQLPLSGFKDGVTACRFFVERYNNTLFTKLGISFPPSLNNALTLRRAEYLAGRVLAKMNLTRLGLSACELLPDQYGIPQWPAGISGSLSHNRKIVVCATLPSEQAGMAGIDIETLISPEDAQLLWRHIISPQEYAFLMAQPLEFHQMLTLVFSAKESFYKLVFPKTRNAMVFHSVRFIAFDLQDGTFSLTIPDELTTLFRSRRYADGTFLLMNDDIATFMYL